MKMHRSFLLPLFAAMALPAVAGKNDTKSSFAYLNALEGSSKTDVYMDGKAIFRNAREGRAMKPRTLSSEGYSVQVNAAKIGFAYLDFTLNLVAGRDYTLIPMGDISTGTISAVLVDLPSLVIPKYSSHVVFAVASPDAPPVDFYIDGQLQGADLPTGGYSAMPVEVQAGKHILEAQIDGVSIYGPKKINLKKGQKTTFVMTGTINTGDKSPVKIEDLVSKGLK